MTACSRDDPPQPGASSPIPRGNALRSPIVENGVRNTAERNVPISGAAIDTVDFFTVKEEIVLEEASPLRMSEKMELLAVRVSYVHREADGYNFSWPGNFCTATWPPKGFGPSESVEGLRLQPKDHIAVTFYSRPRELREASLGGLKMIYRQGDRTLQQTTESTKVVLTAVPVDSKDSPPGCNNPSIWTGDETDQGDGQSQ